MISESIDTIAAIATAAGGGVGMIRLSGPRARDILRSHFEGWPATAAPRRLVHGWWCASGGTRLDEGLATWMAAPRSYTGEDVVELHLHGGALSLRRCLAVCLDAGARLAEPGEFTRRAFLNGKLDLTRAEAIADLIAARSDQALAHARAHLQGALYDAVMAIRERVLALRAKIEVNLDFVEEDVPIYGGAALAQAALDAAASCDALAATWEHGRLLREGARVVLAGRPNAGKSSLFNALCAEDRAIVTPIAGTTRDVLDAELVIAGIPVVLVDTAGLRPSVDPVERAGVVRTEAQVERADVVLHIVPPPYDGAADTLGLSGPRVLRVHSKADLTAAAPPGGQRAPDAVYVSALTGEGLEALRTAIAAALNVGAAEHVGGVSIARERHRQALAAASAALTQSAAVLVADAPAELAAVDLQDATDALARIVGLTTIEDVLDRLFSTFCIGK